MIQSILEQEAVQRTRTNLQITELEESSMLATNNNINRIMSSYKANPALRFDVDELADAFGNDVALQVLDTLMPLRELTEDEVTTSLLSIILLYSASSPSNTASLARAESLFKNLKSKDMKLKLAFFRVLNDSFYKLSPSCKTFLETELNLTTDPHALSKLEVCEYYRSITDNNLHFELTFTKDETEGLEELADSILTLLSLGYTGSKIIIKADHLTSVSGNFNFRIPDHCSLSLQLPINNDGRFSIYKDNAEEMTNYTGNSKPMLVSCLKYLAMNEWFLD
jgi:hypothetical protein